MASPVLHQGPAGPGTTPPLGYLLEHTSTFVTAGELVTFRDCGDGSLRGAGARANAFQKRDHRKKPSAS